MVSNVRPYLRAFALLRDAPPDLVVSTGFTVLTPRRPTDAEFIYHHVLSPRFVRHLEPRMTGSGYPAVRSEDVIDFPILVPPPEERTKIGSVLQSIEDAIEKTEAVIAATERLRKALLEELLTRGIPGWHSEWRTVPGIGRIPACWEVARLGQIADVQAGFALGPERRPKANARPYLTVANVQTERIVVTELRYMEVSPKEYESRHLRVGDVVMVEGHAQLSELGRAAMVSPAVAGFTYQNHLFCVRGNESRCSNRFLCAYINGPRGRSYFRSFGGTTSGLNTVSATNVQGMPVSLPSLEEQRLVAAAADAIGDRLHSERDMLRHLVSVKSFVADALLSGSVRASGPSAELAGRI